MMAWIIIGVFVVNILIGLVIVFVERKSTPSTWAWLMVLFFLPIIGLVLYLIFGRELHNNRWNEEPLFKTNELLQEQKRAYDNQDFYRGNDKDLEHFMIHMHLFHSYAPLTFAQSAELITDGDKKFQTLFQDIRKARSYIHLQYFAIDTDELGREFIQLLTEKANQGVDVMLLYDGVGSFKLTKNYLSDFTCAGGHAKAFFPPKSMFTYGSLNHRNHRKLGVIDDEIAYIGGFNVGNKYNADQRNLGYWRDSHLRLQGSAVHHLHDQFISDWNKGKKRTDEPFMNNQLPVFSSRQDGIPMQIVASGPGFGHNQVKNGFMQMIQKAKHYIYIQTPYFIPDAELLENLRVAILSGIDVRIMIPNKPDHPMIFWSTTFFIGEMLKEGATVYSYDQGFLHAKTMVVDDKVSTLGTANMDVRSANLNFEINAFIYDEPFARHMKETFQHDIAHCSEWSVKGYENRSYWIRLKENVSKLISPLL